MIEIKAYIRSVMVDDVIDALAGLEGVQGIAAVELREYGHALSDDTLQRVKMTKLEVDVDDSLERKVVDTIVETARTGEGHPGDGRVFVTQLKCAVRIADGLKSEA